ncbi:DgyrCDS13033 [Dimorphilus gyrociliatus]|uniref:DgyrCDS13033 n=1 Tax=Dimorphilus gyrociliatus TaxID=2664684 RepID=A0A7I8W9F4_9ANNE|nr:DgyrCDS13033 [Dimorphilus gyrociliatus]
MAAKDSKDKQMRDLVQQVRKSCPSLSNHDTMLVLEYYNNDPERTIKAVRADGAKEALGEWNTTKQSASKKKKKNNKKKVQNQHDDEKSDQPIANGRDKKLENLHTALKNEATRPNSIQVHNQAESKTINNNHGVDASELRQKAKEAKQAGHRKRADSEKMVPINFNPRPPHSGLEKSWKDLQRMAASLNRVQVQLSDISHQSVNEIKTSFRKLHDELNEREAQLMIEVDRVKSDAKTMLMNRHKKCMELKARCDRSSTLNEKEMAFLRTDIKHFVSDRRVDDQFSTATKYSAEFKELLEQIRNFGHLSGVKGHYSTPATPVSPNAEIRKAESAHIPAAAPAPVPVAAKSQKVTPPAPVEAPVKVPVNNKKADVVLPQAKINVTKIDVPDLSGEISVEKKKEAENIADKILNSLNIGTKPQPKKQPKENGKEDNHRSNSGKSKSPEKKSPRRTPSPRKPRENNNSESKDAEQALPQRSAKRPRGGKKNDVAQDQGQAQAVVNGLTNGH